MTLYLGTDPANHPNVQNLIHYPVIKIEPLQVPLHIWDDFRDFTHLLFTSKNGVSIFFDQLKQPIQSQRIIAIGEATAAKLRELGHPPQWIAKDESQEGVIELLKMLDLDNGYVLYPRSTLARKKLEDFLIKRGIRHQVCDLYDTVLQKPHPIPSLDAVQEIVFTSPSTVKGFIAAFGELPKGKKLTCIGPVTENELKKY